MQDSPHNSILVIPSINGGALLERMLPTVRFPAERILVLDQGSTDSTDEVCARAGVEVVQLGHPHTYTEACNIGAEIAKGRGIAYLGVANNDIVFRTDVMGEMAAALDADPRLAVVAPAQIIIDDALDEQPVSYRVLWSLERVAFFHDLDEAGALSERLEADFCELTCVLIRMTAIGEVGFLDDEYGFYHEDADFGFRLRRAGWNSAYLPRTQIEHYSSSTFSKEKASRKADYIAKNKRYFAQKLLGYGMSFAPPNRQPTATQMFSADLRLYLDRYGLIERDAPELTVGYPDVPAAGYLYTPFERGRLPDSWRRHAAGAKGIFVTSDAARAAFTTAGVPAIVVPLGVEPDVFHPWRPAAVRGDEITYLALVDDHQSRSLAVILKAWYSFRVGGRRARLRLLGRGLLDCLGRKPESGYRSGPFETAHYGPEGIEINELLAPLSAVQLADIYRSVDFALYASCGEGLMANVLQAHACGVPCLFGRYGATADLGFADALTFAAAQSGTEPDPGDLVTLLARSFALSARDRAEIGRRGVSDVRSRFTLRHSAMGFYSALADLQSRDPAKLVESLRTRPADKDAIATLVAPPASRFMGRLSGLAARRVQTIGRLTLQLGSDWERKGFFNAGRSTTAELRLFLRHRSRQVSSLATKFGKPSRGRRPHRSAPRPGSTLLLGYVEGQLGLGQSSRDLAQAMETAGIQFDIYPINLGIEGRRSGPFMSERYDTGTAHAVNVVYVTPEELPQVRAHAGRELFDQSYNILRTYWELSQAPESWAAKLEAIDELWVPNAFVADSFRSIFPRTITVVPPCVTIPHWQSVDRDHFGLDADRFYFLFSFDYYSLPHRKNPLAVVRAFRKAFPDQASHVGLIVKSSGAATHYPEIKEEIRAAARYDGRITVIDAHLSRPELLSLMKAADCYVSMHRSEGFGLGMAEAMGMGKPVIGTNYSGNTDFLAEATGYPVTYELRKVGPRDYVHYAKGQVWAEPSETSCVAAMVRVVDDPAEAAIRARAGQMFVEQRYAPESVGQVVAARLQAVFAELATR